MPVVCWGALAKSANDNTTIPEYIASRILEHNVDASSHGLDDYAIWNHRVDPYFDHPDYAISSNKISSDWIISKKFETATGVGPGTAGVTFDPNGIMMYHSGVRKVNIPVTGNPFFLGDVSLAYFTYLKTVIHSNFESLDGWWVTLGGGGCDPGMRALYIETVGSGETSLMFGGQSADALSFDRNPLFQIDAFIEYETAQTAYLLTGDNGGLEDQGFGFKIVNGTLYAYSYSYPNTTTVEITNITLPAWHQYKAVMTSASKIEFYVDTVLKATITTNLPSGDNQTGMYFSLQGTTDSRIMHLKSLLYVEDLPF